ncbi:MAG: hypothetical protein AAF577_07560 [Pseudomonadota bacterium]
MRVGAAATPVRAPRLGAALGLAALAAGLLVACAPAPPPAVRLSVQFIDAAWTGGSIPDGQHCSAEGGQGMLPSLRVAGLPETTDMIHVAVNDTDVPALSSGGGHGILGFAHAVGGPVAILSPVPGERAEMPDGVTLIAANRAERDPAVAGYLPPCSGRAGHVYVAEVTALNTEGEAVGRGQIRLGRY